MQNKVNLTNYVFASGAAEGQLVPPTALEPVHQVEVAMLQAMHNDPQFTTIEQLSFSFHGSLDNFSLKVLGAVSRKGTYVGTFECSTEFVLNESCRGSDFVEEVLERAAKMIGFDRRAEAA